MLLVSSKLKELSYLFWWRGYLFAQNVLIILLTGLSAKRDLLWRPCNPLHYTSTLLPRRRLTFLCSTRRYTPKVCFHLSSCQPGRNLRRFTGCAATSVKTAGSSVSFPKNSSSWGQILVGGRKGADRMLSGERVSFSSLSSAFWRRSIHFSRRLWSTRVLLSGHPYLLVCRCCHGNEFAKTLRKKTFWSRVSVFSVQKIFKGFTTMEVKNRSFVECELKKNIALWKQKKGSGLRM